MIEILLDMADPESVEVYWFGSRIAESVTLLLIGAAIGLLGQLGIDFLRKSDVEDYELWTDVHSASQKAEGIGRLKTGLSIHAGQQEIADPYVVDFYVWGVGKRDIRTEMFDGQTLQFDLDVPIIAELEGSSGGNIESALFSYSPDGVVSLAPSLVRSRVAKKYRFLTDGKPKLEWTNPVADLKVFNFREQWGKPTKDRVVAKWIARILMWLTIAAFVTLLILGIVRGIIEGPQPRTMIPSDEIGLFGVPDSYLASTPWWVFLTPLWLFLIVGFFMYAGAPSRRPRRAERLRYKNLPPTDAPPLKTQRDYIMEQFD